MSNVVHTSGLSRTFQVGDSLVHALDHMDLKIETGDFVAVMGPSGSGKSTLMNILGCLDRPDAGNYELMGEPVATMDDTELSQVRNQKIGFVFQNFHLLPRLTALENVLLPLRYAESGIEEAQQRAPALLDRLGLTERSHHRPNQLSGGQRQRVAIARSLVCDPLLLLADEPTGNLDSKTAAEILQLFVELNEDRQTVLLVTHEDSIAAKAHRVIHMRDGKLEAEVFN